MYSSFAGKTVMIVSASPGALGGLRGVRHLRELLTSMNANVIPQSPSIGSAFKAFTEDGSLSDPKQLEMLKYACESFNKFSGLQANEQVICHSIKLQGHYGDLVSSK
jgi:NAD(P)H-dependent FMN reductase